MCLNIPPKISVIVPCYGVEKYLDRCLSSLVRQSLVDIEIILVDDCSPDKVPLLCDKWAKKDKRIKVVHKQRNEGLGFARNTGLQYATGEYVAFVDSDDFVKEDMFRILFEKSQSSCADVVFCNCVFYKDNMMKTRFDVIKEQIFIGRHEVDSLLFDFIGPEPSFNHDAKYMISVWHAIYKRELFEKHNIKFVSERQVMSEDLIFEIDYLNKAQKVIYIPDALYYYCDNGSSLSRKLDKKRYDRMKIFLLAVKDRLSQYYKIDNYIIHYYRQQFICLRIIMKTICQVPEMGIHLKSVVDDPFWQDMLCSYPYKKMDLKHRLFFGCVKNRILWPLKLLFKLT